MLSCAALLAKLRLLSFCHGPSGHSTVLGQKVTANMPPAGRRYIRHLQAHKRRPHITLRLSHDNIVTHGVEGQGLCGVHPHWQ